MHLESNRSQDYLKVVEIWSYSPDGLMHVTVVEVIEGKYFSFVLIYVVCPYRAFP